MGQKVSFYLILLLAHPNSQTDECEASLFAISIEDSHQSVFGNANVAKVTHVLPIYIINFKNQRNNQQRMSKEPENSAIHMQTELKMDLNVVRTCHANG